jgi:succinate dehydrogenase / fumarate reductase flavoprotein subunit
VISTRPNRVFDESRKSFFERDWPAWLTGRIYDLSEKEGCTRD